jgi:hypothetical protein
LREPKGICWRADRDFGESFGAGDEELIHAPFVFQRNGTLALIFHDTIKTLSVGES